MTLKQTINKVYKLDNERLTNENRIIKGQLEVAHKELRLLRHKIAHGCGIAYCEQCETNSKKKPIIGRKHRPKTKRLISREKKPIVLLILKETEDGKFNRHTL